MQSADGGEAVEFEIVSHRAILSTAYRHHLRTISSITTTGTEGTYKDSVAVGTFNSITIGLGTIQRSWMVTIRNNEATQSQGLDEGWPTINTSSFQATQQNLVSRLPLHWRMLVIWVMKKIINIISGSWGLVWRNILQEIKPSMCGIVDEPRCNIVALTPCGTQKGPTKNRSNPSCQWQRQDQILLVLLRPCARLSVRDTQIHAYCHRHLSCSGGCYNCFSFFKTRLVNLPRVKVACVIST